MQLLKLFCSFFRPVFNMSWFSTVKVRYYSSTLNVFSVYKMPSYFTPERCIWIWKPDKSTWQNKSKLHQSEVMNELAWIIQSNVKIMFCNCIWYLMPLLVVQKRCFYIRHWSIIEHWGKYCLIFTIWWSIYANHRCLLFLRKNAIPSITSLLHPASK